MRLLLDECVPRRLRRDFKGHTVSTIEQAGLKGLKNGALLLAASANFDVLVTVDRNIEFQQNPERLPIAILVLAVCDNRYESFSPLLPTALESLRSIHDRTIIKIEG